LTLHKCCRCTLEFRASDELGVICVHKDTMKALADAQKEGISKPYIFDTASNKLIYLGYIPESPFLTG
jgi:hypothetical protein